MATTSLWHIEGRLKDLIEYVENPEKTALTQGGLSDFLDVFSYVQDEGKTDGGRYVTAINCLKSTALRQMILTKKQFGKEGKYIAWHGYQSFKPDEVSAEECHEIGVELAREMWGDRFQIIVTTHLDKEHLHNHFAFNSVSFRDGRKYNYSKAEQRRLRDTSDCLCAERGLSVIQRPRKAPSRPVWLEEQSGEPTRYNIYRADIQEAIDGSRSPAYMERYLNRKGYITDFTGENWMLRLPQYEHFTRLDTLDGFWTPKNIARTMGCYAMYGNVRPTVDFAPFVPEQFKSVYTPHKPTTQIYRLYLYWCYQLGILPKHTDYKPTSPHLKADIRKMDEISEQVKYMDKYGIATLEDLYADRQKVQSEMNALIARRTKLQNRIRRASPAEKETLRLEKAGVTAQITDLRKRLKHNLGIERRSLGIQQSLDLAYDNEQQAREEQRTRQTRGKELER